jgi:hypothetical protein
MQIKVWSRLRWLKIDASIASRHRVVGGRYADAVPENIGHRFPFLIQVKTPEAAAGSCSA